MNKKTYIKPSIEIAEMATDVIMTSGSIEFQKGEVDTSEEGVQLGTGRRGTWGNLWGGEQ